MPATVSDALLEIGFKLSGIILAALAVYLAGLLRSYLQQKLGMATYERLQAAAETVVRSLEQEGILPQWDGATKKQMAMVMMREACDELKINISDQALSSLIEEMAQVLNTEAGKFSKQLSTTAILSEPLGDIRQAAA